MKRLWIIALSLGLTGGVSTCGKKAATTSSQDTASMKGMQGMKGMEGMPGR